MTLVDRPDRRTLQIGSAVPEPSGVDYERSAFVLPAIGSAVLRGAAGSQGSERFCSGFGIMRRTAKDLTTPRMGERPLHRRTTSVADSGVSFGIGKQTVR